MKKLFLLLLILQLLITLPSFGAQFINNPTQPVLQLPFPVGISYLCSQGSQNTYTHDSTFTLYDLDFDTPNDSDEVITAAASGIAYIILDKGPNSFGNHINIDHGNGYFTVYAHLKSFSISDGQYVTQGQPIGLEGTTGFSTGDHIHFGLHTGDPTKDALNSTSILATRIIAKDNNTSGSFEEMMADQFICDLNWGHFYSSNNYYISSSFWNFNNNPEGWSSQNATDLNVANGIWTIDPNITTSEIDSPYLTNVNANQFRTLEIRMSITGTGNIDIATASFETEEGLQEVTFNITRDGQMHTYTVNVPFVASGAVQRLSLKPIVSGTTDNSDMVSIDHIRFISRYIYWNFDSTQDGWTTRNSISNGVNVELGGKWIIDPNLDPGIVSPYLSNINTSDYYTVKIRLSVNPDAINETDNCFITKNCGYAYFEIDNSGFIEVPFNEPIINDGAPHIYTVTIPKNSGNITRLRIDPIENGINSNSDLLFIDFIKFISTTYTTTQITNNSYNDEWAKINANGDIVWIGNQNKDVFNYKSSNSSIAQITNSSSAESFPQINDRGDMTWSWQNNSQRRSEVYLYQYSTNSMKRLDGYTLNDEYPKINNSGDVVWKRLLWSGTCGVCAQTDIFRYQASTESILRLSNNIYSDDEQQINDNGDIVWSKGGREILFYNNSTGQVRTIFNGNSYNVNPQINDKGDIVWQGYDGLHWDIFVYKNSTDSITRMTNNSSKYQYPQINNNGDMVWVEANGPLGGDPLDAIYLYKASTNSIINILTDGLYANNITRGNPQINNNSDVVWMGYDGTDYEIYSYRSSTGESVQITNNSYDDYYPQINDKGDIVWQGYDGTDYEIFLAKSGRVVLSENLLISPNQAITKTATINQYTSQAIFTRTIPGSDVEMTIIQPDGTIINRSTTDPLITHSLNSNNTIEEYKITNPQAGDWTVILLGTDVPIDGEPTNLKAFVVVGDQDNDGITNDIDNCFSVPNTDQANFDNDSFGNACDNDDDNDGYSDEEEITAGTDPFNPNSKPQIIGDLDNDTDVDKNDLNIIISYRNQPASVCLSCDLDGDGIITLNDARKATLLCTRLRCATE